MFEEDDLEVEDQIGPASDRGRNRRRISEDHPARVGWEIMLFFIMVYHGVTIPYRISFNPSFTFSRDWLIYITADYITDMLLLVDIVLRIRYFEAGRAYQYSDKMRAFVSHPKKAGARAYFRGMFAIDLISVVPYAAIAYAAGYSGGHIAMLRLPRFLRLLRLPGCLGAIRGMLERKNLLVNAGSQRVVLLWSAFFMLGHWVACGWFGIARAIVKSGSLETWAMNDCSNAGWKLPKNVTCESILNGTHPVEALGVHAYIRSLYWALITMVTVGLGDIVPAARSESETLFTVFTMYIGVMLTCTVIGNLTNLVANLDAAEDEFHSKMDNLNKYMAYRHLSQDLRERIRAYYQYIWFSLKGMDEQQFLKDLPSSLRLQVAGLRSRDLVHKVTFFKKAREPLLNAICFNLEQIVVSPGDRVVVEGQSIHGVHFLGRGEAELLSPGSSGVLQNLSGKFGSHFGESSLFFSSTYKNTVKTKSYCEFFFLPREKFDKIAKIHCTATELTDMKDAAEKAMKREAKVKKFFGLDTEAGPTKKNWRRHFEPNAYFRHFWDIVCLLGILYQAFLIPLRIAFMFQRYGEEEIVSWVLDWCFASIHQDIMFVVDIFFKAQLFAFTKEGVVVANRTRIFNRYRKMRDFYCDVFAAVPLDIVYAALPPDELGGLSLLPLLRLNKMLRCYHLQYHLNKAQDFLTELKFNVTNSFSRLFRMLLLVLLFVHWTGCLFLLMAEISIKQASDECDAVRTEAAATNTSWNCLDCRDDWVCYDIENTYNYIDFGKGSDSAKEILYLRAVYFVLVDMTTVGYGDVAPRNTHETFYVVIITLFGGLVYPAVVGAMAALISNLNALHSQFKNKVSTLAKYMELKGFPEDLKLRILRYYDYLWSRQRGVDEDVILNDLPSPLRMEVQQFINGSIIRQIPFFVGMDPDLIRHLLSVLKPAVFLPNDFIIRAGEFGQEMYLLERGATRVTSPDGGMTYAVLTQGDYFGEGCLLKAEKRTAAIRAVGYCDCFVLNRADFEQVSMDYPECRKLLLDLLSNTLQSKKRQNAKVTTNFERHPKLSQTTSFEDDARKEVPLSSIRHPESRKRVYWASVLLLVCLVNATAVPYRLAFPEGVDIWFYVLDYVLDLALLIDIAFSYYVFGYIFEGKVYTDQDDIMSNYRRSRRFWPDILASIPFECLAVVPFFGLPGDLGAFNLTLALARVPKLIRLLRVSEYGNRFAQLVEESELFSDIFLKLLYLLNRVMLICHWMACGFYVVARYSNLRDHDFASCDVNTTSTLVRDISDTSGSCPSGGDYILYYNNVTNMEMCGTYDSAFCKWDQTWVQHQMDTGLINFSGGTAPERYLRALYWAVPTLVVVVIGDVIPVTNMGTFYVAIAIFIGVTINATIIGNIANLVANLEGDSAAFRERKDELEKFLHLYQLPRSVKERARRYYQYVFETQKGFDQSAIIKDLPATLRQEVSSFLKLSFVQKCPFFEFCDPALTKALAYSLTSRVYSPDDFIVHEGDLGREMFFIERGMVQMVSVNDLRKNDNARSSSRARSSLQFSFSINQGASSTICNHQDQTVDNRYTVLSTCSAGQFFGETALFFAERRSCSVRCIDYCELYVLHKSDLEELLRRYPFERDRMFQAVSELQAENIRRNSKVKENFEHKVREGTKLFQFFRSSSSVVVSRLKYNRLFTPGAYFVQMWNIFNLVLMVYLLISIPYRMAFYVPDKAPFKGSSGLPIDVLIWFCLDYSVDIFFIVDMYLHGAKFAFLDEGKLVNDPTLIFARYRKNFIRHVVANLPVDLALIPIYLTAPNKSPNDIVLWDCSLITDVLDSSNSFTPTVQSTTADLKFTGHACRLEGARKLPDDPDIANTWAVIDELAEFDIKRGGHNVMRETQSDDLIPMHLICYIRAFYFTITTLSTVGYGDIRPYTPLETVFELIVVTSGACVFAAIIGSIAVLFFSMDSTGDIAFKDKLRKVKSYMKYRQLPKGLQKQILSHFVTLWDRQKGVVLKEILADLPVPMQLDIAYYVNREVIRKTPGLRKCSKQVQKNIALALSPQVCSPGDFVYRAGDIGHEIYFILYGEVNVLVDGGKTVSASLSAGDLFGETAIHSASGERKESVRAVTQCDLYYMHKSRLEDILSDYPEESGTASFFFTHDDVSQEYTFSSQRLFHRTQLIRAHPTALYYFSQDVFAMMFKRQESIYSDGDVSSSRIKSFNSIDMTASGLSTTRPSNKDDLISPLQMFAQMQKKNVQVKNKGSRRCSMGVTLMSVGPRDTNDLLDKSQSAEPSSTGTLKRSNSLNTFGITSLCTEYELELYDSLVADHVAEAAVLESGDAFDDNASLSDSKPSNAAKTARRRASKEQVQIGAAIHRETEARRRASIKRIGSTGKDRPGTAGSKGDRNVHDASLTAVVSGEKMDGSTVSVRSQGARSNARNKTIAIGSGNGSAAHSVRGPNMTAKSALAKRAKLWNDDNRSQSLQNMGNGAVGTTVGSPTSRSKGSPLKRSAVADESWYAQGEAPRSITSGSEKQLNSSDDAPTNAKAPRKKQTKKGGSPPAEG